jgi:LacI family transcriptional regulator
MQADARKSSREMSVKKATLKDVAELTGLSINTVSRALRGLPHISPETGDRVAEAARRLGYLPDMVASSMRSGRTKTVALIVPDILDPLFALWAKSIEALLYRHEYHALILNTDEDSAREEYAVNLALGKKVEGIILCPAQQGSRDIQLLKRVNVPFVLIGRHFTDIKTDYVVMDDMNGAFIATQYLIDSSRRNILYLNACSWISSARERRAGYMKALEKNGIPTRPELIQEVDIVKPGDCNRVLRELRNAGIQFNGVLAFSDLIAWQMIYFMTRAGIAVPKDVAVIGFDNLQSSIYYPYSLTSVTYSKQDVVDATVRILLRRMRGKDRKRFERVVIRTSLFVGEST